MRPVPSPVTYTERARLDDIVASFVFCGTPLTVEAISVQYRRETDKDPSAVEVRVAIGRSRK